MAALHIPNAVIDLDGTTVEVLTPAQAEASAGRFAGLNATGINGLIRTHGVSNQVWTAADVYRQDFFVLMEYFGTDGTLGEGRHINHFIETSWQPGDPAQGLDQGSLCEWYHRPSWYATDSSSGVWTPVSIAGNTLTVTLAYYACTANATTDRITVTGWTPVAGRVVRLWSDTGDLPAGLENGKDYYVINVVSSTCQLATTASGTAVNFTDAGTGNMIVWDVAGDGAFPGQFCNGAVVRLLTSGTLPTVSAASIADDQSGYTSGTVSRLYYVKNWNLNAGTFNLGTDPWTSATVTFAGGSGTFKIGNWMTGQSGWNPAFNWNTGEWNILYGYNVGLHRWVFADGSQLELYPNKDDGAGNLSYAGQYGNHILDSHHYTTDDKNGYLVLQNRGGAGLMLSTWDERGTGETPVVVATSVSGIGHEVCTHIDSHGLSLRPKRGVAANTGRDYSTEAPASLTSGTGIYNYYGVFGGGQWFPGFCDIVVRGTSSFFTGPDRYNVGPGVFRVLTNVGGFDMSPGATANAGLLPVERLKIDSTTATFSVPIAASFTSASVFALNTRGVVPGPGSTSGTTYLRDDGTWATPAGGGSLTSGQISSGTTLSNSDAEVQWCDNSSGPYTIYLPPTPSNGKQYMFFNSSASGSNTITVDTNGQNDADTYSTAAYTMAAGEKIWLVWNDSAVVWQRMI